MTGARTAGDLSGATIIAGGRVLDPSRGVDVVADLAIRDGFILGTGDYMGRLDSSAARVIDASGLLVVPGLVDMHTHLFHTVPNPDAWAGENSVPPDAFSFRSGVTTMVDAGSAGWRNFDYFRVTVIERSKTRVFAFVNIASYGMLNDIIEQHAPDFDPDATARAVARNGDVAVGIKSAHYWRPDWASVDRAVDAGEKSKRPVMVDFGYFMKERPYWRLVSEHLRPGDISTHCFRGPVPTADEAGRVYPYLWEARRRGVLFDLGHGGGSFLFRNAAPAFREGFYPDVISTDLHVQSMNAAMMDMPTTMSKCLALGMPLSEIIAAATFRPARAIGHAELGTLFPGTAADVALFGIRKGTFGFADSVGGRIEGAERFECEMTFRNGTVVWYRNARAASDYRTLPGNAGIREGEYLIPPVS